MIDVYAFRYSGQVNWEEPWGWVRGPTAAAGTHGLRRRRRALAARGLVDERRPTEEDELAGDALGEGHEATCGHATGAPRGHDHVTRPHPFLRIATRAHTFGRAGGDDVARFKRNATADIRD